MSASFSKLIHVVYVHHLIIKKGCVFDYENEMDCYSFFGRSLPD